MYSGRINVFNPYGPQILERGIKETLDNTDKYFAPFLQLLGSRWVVAADHDPEKNTKIFNAFDQVDCSMIVTHDWFMTDLIRYTEGTNSLSNFPGRIVIFSDLPASTENSVYDSAAMNPFNIDRNAHWKEQQFYPYSHYNTDTNQKAPIVPMGCGHDWLSPVCHYDKVIFLDEPHTSLLECLDDDNDIRTRLYRHALKVARVLHDRGFKIISFCRTPSQKFIDILREHDFIDAHYVGGWVPFSDLLLSYSRASLFFSFTSETFGYPLYENLQLGNGIITYSEANDPYTFLQMQNATILSVYMTDILSADLICEFYNRYTRYSLRPIISQDAFERFASETFIKRLRIAL